MDKQTLIKVVLDQRQELLPDQLIERRQYQYILSLLDNPQVLVISGIRRCGKSTIMHTIPIVLEI